MESYIEIGVNDLDASSDIKQTVKDLKCIKDILVAKHNNVLTFNMIPREGADKASVRIVNNAIKRGIL
jgi:hypothetical protein